MDQNTQPAPEPAQQTLAEYLAAEHAAVTRAEYGIYFGQHPEALGEHNPWL